LASGRRPTLRFTICIRDDDAKVFEFRVIEDSASIMSLVAAAVARGRSVRAYLLAADPHGRAREEKYLDAKGYSLGSVKL